MTCIIRPPPTAPYPSSGRRSPFLTPFRGIPAHNIRIATIHAEGYPDPTSSIFDVASMYLHIIIACFPPPRIPARRPRKLRVGVVGSAPTFHGAGRASDAGIPLFRMISSKKGETRKMTVIMTSTSEVGRVMNIEGSPPEIMRDCLSVRSRIGHTI